MDAIYNVLDVKSSFFIAFFPFNCVIISTNNKIRYENPASTGSVAVITYKTRSTSKLAYLSDLLQDYRPARTLRSSDKLLLSVPQMALAFSVKALALVPLQFGTRCHISVDLLNCLARSVVS